MKIDKLITARFVALENFLDERQRRLYAAVEAKVLGHGGLKRVHEATIPPQKRHRKKNGSEEQA